MRPTVLIVPCSRAAPDGHWLAWMEAQLAGARRVPDDDEGGSAVLDRRAHGVSRAIVRAGGPVWIIAHGFGCLAVIHAAAAHPDRVAGALLVAPADPERFVADGPRRDDEDPLLRPPSISAVLPRTATGFMSLVVAHEGATGMRLLTAAQWAERWGSRLLRTDTLGGIDPATHRGPWPQGLHLFQRMQYSQRGLPLGSVADART